MDQLVSYGNTVIVIEHNLDVIKTADWIIDLGPDGGDKGGEIIAQGTPEELIKINNTYTCLLYTSPSPRDKRQSRMPSSA